ncbi:hypothetical protein M0R45_015912 [Rubus argutus]|uniref:Uncharacterized protein n=1 Tax=Rubus argutus TaxID=59490 RepID=A0AAW1XSE1_RUBAR
MVAASEKAARTQLETEALVTVASSWRREQIGGDMAGHDAGSTWKRARACGETGGFSRSYMEGHEQSTGLSTAQLDFAGKKDGEGIMLMAVGETRWVREGCDEG